MKLILTTVGTPICLMMTRTPSAKGDLDKLLQPVLVEFSKQLIDEAKGLLNEEY